MADFSFVHDPQTDGWIISAPRRAKRPHMPHGSVSICPFCPAQIVREESVYEVKPSVISSQVSVIGSEFIGFSDSQTNKQKTDQLDSENRPQKTDNRNPWLIKVIKNKYPFAPIHEVIILTPEHNKNFDSMTFHHVELAVQTYRQRFQTYEAEGQVYIFHNHGPNAGESIPHAHSQVTVIPAHVTLRIPPPINTHVLPVSTYQETDHFRIHCPPTSVWSDEVWVSPKREGKSFSEVSDDEVSDFAFVLSRLVKIFKLRYEDDFPYNFYIYPGKSWYFRLIPRKRTLGGFEVGTGVFVNTQDPLLTIAFVKEHFMTPDEEKIRREHRADYQHRV